MKSAAPKKIARPKKKPSARPNRTPPTPPAPQPTRPLALPPLRSQPNRLRIVARPLRLPAARPSAPNRSAQARRAVATIAAIRAS